MQVSYADDDVKDAVQMLKFSEKIWLTDGYTFLSSAVPGDDDPRRQAWAGPKGLRGAGGSSRPLFLRAAGGRRGEGVIDVAVTAVASSVKPVKSARWCGWFDGSMVTRLHFTPKYAHKKLV